jgi:hypothetical protein
VHSDRFVPRSLPLLISSVAERPCRSRSFFPPIHCSILPSGYVKDDHGYVSLEYASVRVVDATEPETLIGWLRSLGVRLTWIGLEVGPLLHGCMPR